MTAPIKLKTTAIAAALFLSAGSAFAAPLTGFWQSTFDDGNPSGWFYFYEKNGLYEGRLVKMFKKKGETSLVTTCSACTGAKKDKPMLGLVIVYNLKPNAGKFTDGNILDPRDGSVYNASAEVTPDGKTLLLRGYLGMEFLGQTQTWTRLPDSTMALADVPGDPPLAAKSTTKPASAPKPATAAPHGEAAPEADAPKAAAQ